MRRFSRHLGLLPVVAVGLLVACGGSTGHTPTPAPSPALSLRIVTTPGRTPVTVDGFNLGSTIICQASPSKGTTGSLEIQGQSLAPAGYQVTIRIEPYRGDGGYVVPAEYGGIYLQITLVGPGLASAAASVGAGHYVNPLVAYQSNGQIMVSENGQHVTFSGQAATVLGRPATAGSALQGSATC
jgi:hypothetical protein